MANNADLRITARLQDFATAQLKKLKGEIVDIGDVATLKLNKSGAALSQLSGVLGSELGGLGGRALSSVHSLSEAFSTPGFGLVAGIGAAYAAVLLLKPKLEEIGAAFEKITKNPALNQGLLTALFPQNAAGIKDAFADLKRFEEDRAAASKALEDAPARLEKFNAAIDEQAKAFQRAALEAKIFGAEAGATLQKQVAATGAAVLTLSENLDKAQPEQVDKYLALFATLRDLQGQFEKFQEVKKESIRVDGEDAAALEASTTACRAYADSLRDVELAKQDAFSHDDFLTGAKLGFQQLAQEATKFGDVARRSVLGIVNAVGDDLSDALLDVVTHAKSAKEAFKALARQILVDIAKIIIKEVVLLAIKTAIAAVGGPSLLSFNIGGSASSDKGNVFSAGRIVPFARGGIIDRPIAFSMSDGRIGTAAERRPEAIIPLARNHRGELGVNVASGVAPGATSQTVIQQGHTFSVYVSVQQPKDGGSRESAREFGQRVAAAVVSELHQDARFRQALKGAA